MAITSQAELQVRTRLTELARAQRSADQTAWTDPRNASAAVKRGSGSSRNGARVVLGSVPGVPPVTQLAPRGWERPRWLLGLALIRLGAVIAGPALPPLPTGGPPRHA